MDDEGFRIEPRYGKSAKVEEGSIGGIEPDTFGSLLNKGFVFDVDRQPTLYDMDEVEGEENLSYGPFHWVVEFPEAVTSDGNGYSVGFDVVVGNPPYGDVLIDAERNFVRGYQTGKINDIAIPFIERELQLLEEGGYFGNINSMGVVYQGSAATARDMIQARLADGKIACFGHRPATVFEGANPRAAITTGRKSITKNGEKHSIETSQFILFYPEGRDAAFRGIEYGAVDGLILGDHIGDDSKNSAYPKVGTEASRSTLCNLRDNSDRTIGDAMTRKETTDYVVYRARHPLYWINPFLENLYEQRGENVPQDFEPMYFETELERKTAFLLMQSSLFYHYWMTYENQRDLNWGPIEAFPFPTHDTLKEHESAIEEIADGMWTSMVTQFSGREISQGSRLKPFADQADDLLAPLIGLDDEQIEWVKDYHTEFGRAVDEEENSDQ